MRRSVFEIFVLLCSEHAAPCQPAEQRSSQKNLAVSAKLAEHPGVNSNTKNMGED